MSSKERGILERYANWHPAVPSLKSVDKDCSGCGSCSGGGGGCGGGTCSGSCSQCGGCTNAFLPGGKKLGGAGRVMRRR